MLQEAEHGTTQLALDPNAGNDRLFAQFYLHAKQNTSKSLAAGRPIFEDLTYIMMMAPGAKGNIVRRPIRQGDRERFPKQWAQFEGGQEQVQDGTPLEQWPLLTRGQAEELKFFGVHTVEALALMSDSSGQNFMGLSKLRQQAKDYMEAAKSEAPMRELRAENDALRARLDRLEAAKSEPDAVEPSTEAPPAVTEAPKPRRRRRATTEE